MWRHPPIHIHTHYNNTGSMCSYLYYWDTDLTGSRVLQLVSHGDQDRVQNSLQEHVDCGKYRGTTVSKEGANGIPGVPVIMWIL